MRCVFDIYRLHVIITLDTIEHASMQICQVRHQNTWLDTKNAQFDAKMQML